jgi:fido (protein-threonine AMPylation protein)
MPNIADTGYSTPSKPEYDARLNYWRCAEGLQKVDGLSTSVYAKNLANDYTNGHISSEEAIDLLRLHYKNPGITPIKHTQNSTNARQTSNLDSSESDFVAMRITQLLERGSFVLTPAMLTEIHAYIFQDLDAATYSPGVFKHERLIKAEPILNGDSVLYADPSLYDKSLSYLFDREAIDALGRSADLAGDSLLSFARFIANIWQVHPFLEGNTRTTAVFSILYLRFLGFDINNDPFANNSDYFRGALVRSIYRNASANIAADDSYLTKFYDAVIHGVKDDFCIKQLECRGLFDNPTLIRNI